MPVKKPKRKLVTTGELQPLENRMAYLAERMLLDAAQSLSGLQTTLNMMQEAVPTPVLKQALDRAYDELEKARVIILQASALPTGNKVFYVDE